MSFIDRYEKTLLDAARRQAETGPAVRSRRPRRAAWIGGIAIAGVAAAAGALLLPAGARLSPIEQAQAALEPGAQILHLKILTVPDTRWFERPRCFPTEPIEMWQATEGDVRLRVRTPEPTAESGCPTENFLPDDTPVAGSVDYASRPGERTSYSPTMRRAVRLTTPDGGGQPPTQLDLVAPALGFSNTSNQASDPQAGLRRVLGSPGVRDEGESTDKSGRLVRTFRADVPIETPNQGRAYKASTVDYVVDAESFKPVRVTHRVTADISGMDEEGPATEEDGAVPPPVWKEMATTLEFPLWEYFPLDADHEHLLEIDIPADATVIESDERTFSQDLTRDERLQRAKDGKERFERWKAEQEGGANAAP